MHIYYSGTPTRRGKDVSKSLSFRYILSSSVIEKAYSNFFIKVFNILRTVYFDIKLLKKLKSTHLIYEHAADFTPTLTVLIFNLLFKVKFIIDCHTCVYVDCNYGFIRNLINRKVIKMASIFIAHNEETLLIKGLHKNMFALESKVPKIKDHKNLYKVDNNKKNVVFITRFNSDEPILEMLECTKLLPKQYEFYITGDYKKIFKDSDIKKYNRVKFTGFLNDETYNSIIHNCDVHVVLTKRDYTLLYGGRESISVEKPLVISNNKPCINFFKNAAVYVNNDSKNIADGIINAFENRGTLISEIKKLKNEKRIMWDLKINKIRKKIFNK